ncbi:MAG: SPASM domain-containing protein [Clostridia bacterium]|nr:SPASM domain-containing protein [Clostridia bacterium]
MSNHKKAYLEITNVCNLSCAFCPGTTRPAHTLTEDEFVTLANRVKPWAEYLYYHLMGEPTAHPLLPKFISIASDLGFKSIITTNGTLLKSRGDAIIAAKPYKINISLHAFEANPPGMSFDEYINSCLDFAQNAADSGIITVLRLWNLDGKADGALNEKNDSILAAMHKTFPDEWTKTRSGERIYDRVFLEWGDKFDWPDPTGDIINENGFCYGLRDQIGVLCDGTVVPCCLDHNGDIPLGNLFTQTLDEILASPRSKAIYDGFTAHKCNDNLCKRCMRAGYYRA